MTKFAHRLRIHGLLLALSLGLSACATTPTAKPFDTIFGASDPARATFDAWFTADSSARNFDLAPGENASTTQHFAHAEIAYFDGDLERAADLYLHILAADPAHPLSRLAAVRLYTLRDEVTDFHARVRPAIESIRLGDVPPLTRVALNRLGQVLHWHDWNTSELEQPFEADALGFATTWMTTPQLSPWRLTDLARTFPPEKEPALEPAYRTPTFAEDAPVTREPTRIYQTANLSLAPGFERSGIYYLETFAHIPADAPGRDFLLYANFPSAARVWIDDTLVLEPNEDAYGSNELLRPIRLSPGTHRILIKLAYQRNYRDNFDLALLADDATPLGNSGLTFSATPDLNSDLTAKPTQPSTRTARVELLGAPKTPAALEPVLVAPEDARNAHDIALYITLNAAYLDLEAQPFEAAWDELTKRHPDFAPAYMLRARQIQTLWEVPSRIRDARALADLRQAHQLAPHSLANRTRLGRWLRNQGRNDDELQNLLRQNRDEAIDPDGRLVNITALYEWARFLDAQNWRVPAEEAWHDLIAAAPTECGAASALAQSYANRGFYPPLESITPAWQQCPELIETRTLARPDQQAERLAIYRRYAARYPYRSGPQLRYARELIAQGQPAEARSTLTAAAERIPWSSDLPYELARLLLADKGPDAARDEILATMDAQNDYARLHWRLTALQNQIPLQSLMHDGKKEAMADVARTAVLTDDANAHSGSDEAYYVLDFAARKFFPDGSAITLTHNLIRVMTKGAIDRFGEFSAPDDAYMVQIRTIKQDGSVRVPEYTPGKSALSMPGLAPGDFVEYAYIQYSAPNPLSRTRREGIRFFFRMADISSRRSEFLVLGSDAAFQKANQAPDTETIDTPEGPAVRFLRVDSPRPRREPSQVGWDEYLPWVQLHHEGLRDLDGFEAARRTVAEGIRDSLKMSPQLRRQISQWREGLQPGSADEVTQLYYRVAGWIADPRMDDFSTDISHALLERAGNPMMLLKATYDAAGIPADIYLVKSKYQAPATYKVAEFSKYRTPLLKVTRPDATTVWLDPAGPDAMFNTINLSALGQPAVCVTCPTQLIETVPADQSRPATRAVHVGGNLTSDGTLQATMTLTFHGARASMLRAALRQNADPSSRQKLIDLTIANILPGASLDSFELDDLADPDLPLVIRATFERPDFAQNTAPGTLHIQTQLFPEAVADSWAELAARETPLLLPYQYDFDYSFQLELPPGMQASLKSRQGDWTHQSAFGTYTRSAHLEQNTLHVRAHIQMPVQRVAPADYAKFRQWATDVDRSALLFVDLKAPQSARLRR